ncbi:membrane-associated protein, putative [Bodo saltans]|uniref:Membrane-associated protein, putative n=1 Tax=Bodo saltans TaxID=75058 RepID=A0A0S4IM23_BODSA|nr:membrane-associated protein, putative [Bodo saltans]|eukprot:CUE72691.1 membrane-associated protein, putative [Bodo saltans]
MTCSFVASACTILPAQTEQEAVQPLCDEMKHGYHQPHHSLSRCVQTNAQQNVCLVRKCSSLIHPQLCWWGSRFWFLFFVSCDVSDDADLLEYSRLAWSCCCFVQASSQLCDTHHRCSRTNSEECRGLLSQLKVVLRTKSSNFSAHVSLLRMTLQQQMCSASWSLLSVSLLMWDARYLWGSGATEILPFRISVFLNELPRMFGTAAMLSLSPPPPQLLTPSPSPLPLPPPQSHGSTMLHNLLYTGAAVLEGAEDTAHPTAPPPRVIHERCLKGSGRWRSFSLVTVVLLWLFTLNTLPLSQVYRTNNTQSHVSVAFAHAQSWSSYTSTACTTTGNAIVSSTVYYQFVGCTLTASPLVITNAAGLWISGGSYYGISFVAPTVNGFVLTVSSATFTQDVSQYTFSLPVMSNWMITFTDTTVSSATGNALIRFAGSVSSTTIVMVSSTFATTSASSNIGYFGGSISNITCTINTTQISSQANSFFVVSTVSLLHIFVGDGTHWVSSLNALLYVLNDVTNFSGTFIADAIGINLTVLQTHFQFLKNGNGVSISSVGANLESTSRPGTTPGIPYPDSNGDNVYFGLVYFSSNAAGVTVSNVNVHHSNYTYFNLEMVVRVESSSAIVDGVSVSLANFNTTGAGVFTCMIYAPAGTMNNIAFYAFNVYMYCFFSCIYLDVVTNLTVIITGGSANVYIGVVALNEITNALITYTSNPNSYTKEQLTSGDIVDGDNHIRSQFDTIITAYITMIGVNLYVSGKGLEFYGNFENVGMLAAAGTDIVKDCTVTFHGAEVADLRTDVYGGAFATLLSSSIAGISVLIQDTFYTSGYAQYRDSTRSFVFVADVPAYYSTGVPVMTGVSIRMINSYFSLYEGFLNFNIDPTSTNVQISMSSVTMTTSNSYVEPLMQFTSVTSGLGVYTDHSTFSSTDTTGTANAQFLVMGGSSLTSVGVIISHYQSTFACNPPCSIVAYDGALSASTIRIESTQMLNNGYVGSGGMAVLVSPASSGSTHFSSGAIKFIDVGFDGTYAQAATLVSLSSSAVVDTTNIFIKCVTSPTSATSSMWSSSSTPGMGGGTIAGSTFTISHSSWLTSSASILDIGGAGIGTTSFVLSNLALSTASAGNVFSSGSLGSGATLTFACVTFNGVAESSGTFISGHTMGLSPVSTACPITAECGRRTKTKSLSFEPENLQVFDSHVFAITKTYGTTHFFSGSSVTYMNQRVGTVYVDAGASITHLTSAGTAFISAGATVTSMTGAGTMYVNGTVTSLSMTGATTLTVGSGTITALTIAGGSVVNIHSSATVGLISIVGSSNFVSISVSGGSSVGPISASASQSYLTIYGGAGSSFQCMSFYLLQSSVLSFSGITFQSSSCSFLTVENAFHSSSIALVGYSLIRVTSFTIDILNMGELSGDNTILLRHVSFCSPCTFDPSGVVFSMTGQNFLNVLSGFDANSSLSLSLDSVTANIMSWLTVEVLNLNNVAFTVSNSSIGAYGDFMYVNGNTTNMTTIVGDSSVIVWGIGGGGYFIDEPNWLIGFFLLSQTNSQWYLDLNNFGTIVTCHAGVNITVVMESGTLVNTYGGLVSVDDVMTNLTVGITGATTNVTVTQLNAVYATTLVLARIWVSDGAIVSVPTSSLAYFFFGASGVSLQITTSAQFTGVQLLSAGYLLDSPVSNFVSIFSSTVSVTTDVVLISGETQSLTVTIAGESSSARSLITSIGFTVINIAASVTRGNIVISLIHTVVNASQLVSILSIDSVVTTTSFVDIFTSDLIATINETFALPPAPLVPLQMLLLDSIFVCNNNQFFTPVSDTTTDTFTTTMFNFTILSCTISLSSSISTDIVSVIALDTPSGLYTLSTVTITSLSLILDVGAAACTRAVVYITAAVSGVPVTITNSSSVLAITESNGQADTVIALVLAELSSADLQNVPMKFLQMTILYWDTAESSPTKDFFDAGFHRAFVCARGSSTIGTSSININCVHHNAGLSAGDTVLYLNGAHAFSTTGITLKNSYIVWRDATQSIVQFTTAPTVFYLSFAFNAALLKMVDGAVVVPMPPVSSVTLYSIIVQCSWLGRGVRLQTVHFPASIQSVVSATDSGMSKSQCIASASGCWVLSTDSASAVASESYTSSNTASGGISSSASVSNSTTGTGTMSIASRSPSDSTSKSRGTITQSWSLTTSSSITMSPSNSVTLSKLTHSVRLTSSSSGSLSRSFSSSSSVSESSSKSFSASLTLSRSAPKSSTTFSVRLSVTHSLVNSRTASATVSKQSPSGSASSTTSMSQSASLSSQSASNSATLTNSFLRAWSSTSWRVRSSQSESKSYRVSRLLRCPSRS